MQGKILIVDAIATNRIVLKVKLAAAFYNVAQAASKAEAIATARKMVPDLIISALDLPDGSSAHLCEELQKFAATSNIPVIAIGNGADRETRMATFKAGVQDVLQKPIDDTLLLGRVRSLIRAHNAASEWQLRDDTSRALGLAEPAADFTARGNFVLVGDDRTQLQGWTSRLRPALSARLSVSSTAEIMGKQEGHATPDVFVLILPENPASAATTLRLISALRANAATRHAGLMVLQTASDSGVAANALDLGADDLMTGTIDPAELALRLSVLLRRTRVADQLRATVRTGLQAALFDPLTGLHNRRYAMSHLARIAERAQAAGRSFAVMVADLDHFKRINDAFGHGAGDAVLVETAQRLRSSLRAVDMVARIGGEEFLIVMPATSATAARAAAIRLCDAIGSVPVSLPGSGERVHVTISIGMAIGCDPQEDCLSPKDTGEKMMEQADKALYAAKLHGRNQVTLGRPAA